MQTLQEKTGSSNHFLVALNKSFKQSLLRYTYSHTAKATMSTFSVIEDVFCFIETVLYVNEFCIGFD